MAAFDFDFTLQQGEFTLAFNVRVDARALALFGPSGSGKTSALEAVAGLRTPRHGRIVVNGHVLVDTDRHVNTPVRHRRTGYVPQDILLFPHLNVRDNVTYGRRDGNRPDLTTLTDLLELTPLMNRRVGSLSGGERQRVAMARALYSGPDVLLLDEPLAAVDLPRRRRIVDALLGIRDQLGVPLIYVTHLPEEAFTVADWAVLIDNGQIIAAGTPNEIFESRSFGSFETFGSFDGSQPGSTNQKGSNTQNDPNVENDANVSNDPNDQQRM
jgi:molybdate transport system ATP-binding protein